MTKHTPGPWRVGRVRESYWNHTPMSVEVPVYFGDGNTLALVYLGGPGALYANEESVLANARLIAAAPDLLEALHDACLTYAAYGEQPPQKWLDAIDASNGNHS